MVLVHCLLGSEDIMMNKIDLDDVGSHLLVSIYA